MFIIGTIILDSAINPPRKNTIRDGLRYFFIIPPSIFKKIKVPNPDQIPIHKAYFTSSDPTSQKVRVLERAPNKIIYIQVADVT
jgi:hypothetical protein